MSAFEDKIQSIRNAFIAGLYEPALALALTIPDICGQIEFQQLNGVGERYILWCNNHVGFCNNDLKKNGSCVDWENQGFSGAALYQLRCSFLHSGNDIVYKKSKNAKTCVMISRFDIMKPKLDGETHREELSSFITWKNKNTGKLSYAMKMNLRQIVDDICDAAEEFYNKRNDKSAFDEHTVRFVTYSEENAPEQYEDYISSLNK